MSFATAAIEDIKGVLHDLAAAAGALHLHDQINEIGKDAAADGEGLAKEAGQDLVADVSRETGPAEPAPSTPSEPAPAVPPVTAPPTADDGHTQVI